MDSWLSLLWVVICVALILVLAYLFTRYVAARGLPNGFGGRGAEALRVLSRLPVGRDGTLAVVQAGERYFLLGITPSAISNLAEFTKEEAEAWSAKQEEQPAPPSFKEALHTVIRQRRQR